MMSPEDHTNSIERFRLLLRERANLDLSPVELSEILWLATQRSQHSFTPPTPTSSDGPEAPTVPPQAVNPPLPSSLPPVNLPQPPPVPIVPEIPQPTQDASPKRETALPVKIPEAVALRNRREIAKSLRPLMRKVPSRTRQEIDEDATVLSIAENENKVWHPVMEPAPERWLELAIVIETTSLLDVWRDTIAEFQRLLERHGAFRDVRTWQLQLGNQNKPQLILQTALGLRGKARSPKELQDISGRRLILFLSDCTSRAWRSGIIPKLLQQWSQSNPVTLVQLLPERYWDRSALKSGQLAAFRSRLPGALSQDWILEGLSRRRQQRWQHGLRLPVVTLRPESLTRWAKAMAVVGEQLTTGIILDLAAFQMSEGVSQRVASLDGQQLVERFRGTASAEAQELADVMAVFPVNWSVIRLIQKNLAQKASDSAQSTGALHLAEIFLSGLIAPLATEVSQDGQRKSTRKYQFVEGVREALLGKIPISEAKMIGEEVAEQAFKQLPQEVQQRVSADIERRYGEALSYFEAFLVPDLPWGEDTVAEILPFAEVTGQVLRLWGGDYAKLADDLEHGGSQRDDNKNTSSLQHQTLFPGDRGSILKHKILEAYHPQELLQKKDANEQVIELDRDGDRLTCLYTGYSISLPATERLQDRGFERKMTFDSICSQGEGSKDFRRDMHNICPAKAEVNSAKGNLPFVELSEAETQQWFRGDRLSASSPNRSFGEYSQKGVRGFEPRDYAKGFLARTLFYVYTMYEGQADQAFFEKQKDVLRKWHNAYPATQAELLRSRKIAESAQGNENPFVIDPTLVDRIFFSDPSEPETGWQTFEFTVATLVVLSTEEVEVAYIETESELTPFEFEIATVVRRFGLWKVERSRRQAWQQIVDLGKGITLEMISIPGGSFVMGAPETEAESSNNERPQHTVTLNSFLMAKYPVTQTQWRKVVSLPQVNRELSSEPSHFKGDELPVESISWLDAVEFCDRLSNFTGQIYRLPTEAEWEYACRAGTETPFHFGETVNADLVNYNAQYSYLNSPKGRDLRQTTLVGSFAVANAFGLYDMHGNVWEWCEDHWHNNYEGAPSDGSSWANDEDRQNSRTRKLLRGGSWVNVPEACRSATRFYDLAGNANNYFGFRVVCSAARTL